MMMMDEHPAVKNSSKAMESIPATTPTARLVTGSTVFDAATASVANNETEFLGNTVKRRKPVFLSTPTLVVILLALLSIPAYFLSVGDGVASEGQQLRTKTQYDDVAGGDEAVVAATISSSTGSTMMPAGSIGVGAIVYQQKLIAGFQYRIALASMNIMKQDTMEAFSQKEVHMDIGPLLDIVEDAIETVGVRAVHSQILELQSFSDAMNFVAEAMRMGGPHKKHYPLFRAWPSYSTSAQATVRYSNIPNDRNRGGSSTGSYFWLMHWIGAITADKLLKEGSLLLDSLSGERIHNVVDFYQEVQALQRKPDAEINSFHTQHGFIWQYLAMQYETKPLKSFPVELARQVCGDLIEKDEFVDRVHNDIGRECRHGFGHAIFYTLASQEFKNELNLLDTRLQLRSASGFHPGNHTLCKALLICEEAKEVLGLGVHTECLGGFGHSLWEYSVGEPPKKRFPQEHEEAMCKDIELDWDEYALKMNDWSTYDWEELPEDIQQAAMILGYNESTWNDDEEPDDLQVVWDDLTSKKKEAAKNLGYNKSRWEREMGA